MRKTKRRSFQHRILSYCVEMNAFAHLTVIYTSAPRSVKKEMSGDGIVRRHSKKTKKGLTERFLRVYKSGCKGKGVFECAGSKALFLFIGKYPARQGAGGVERDKSDISRM